MVLLDPIDEKEINFKAFIEASINILLNKREIVKELRIEITEEEIEHLAKLLEEMVKDDDTIHEGTQVDQTIVELDSDELVLDLYEDIISSILYGVVRAKDEIMEQARFISVAYHTEYNWAGTETFKQLNKMEEKLRHEVKWISEEQEKLSEAFGRNLSLIDETYYEKRYP